MLKVNCASNNRDKSDLDSATDPEEQAQVSGNGDEPEDPEQLPGITQEDSDSEDEFPPLPPVVTDDREDEHRYDDGTLQDQLQERHVLPQQAPRESQSQP